MYRCQASLYHIYFNPVYIRVNFKGNEKSTVFPKNDGQGTDLLDSMKKNRGSKSSTWRQKVYKVENARISIRSTRGEFLMN